MTFRAIYIITKIFYVTCNWSIASSGLFSWDAALAAMVLATERLGYAKLSAEQEEAVLHFLSD